MKSLEFKKFNIRCLLLISLAVFCLSVSAVSQEGNDVNILEDPILLEEPRIPGIIEGTGKYFEVKDSNYLNITLESSELVLLRLESVLKMVTIEIEAAEGATSSEIILTGFEPSTTYYKYQDDYNNLEIFATDPNGSYTFIQDLTKPHLVFIQPNASTKFIPGDTSIGTWDPVTRIYTLNTDVYETIQISENNLTLDGAGHSVTGTGAGSGIYLHGRDGVNIMNLNVQTFGHGIMVYRSSNNNFLDVTVQGTVSAIYVSNSDNNHIENWICYNNYYCIYMRMSSFNSIANSEMYNNSYYGIYLNTNTSSNTITGNNIHHNGTVQYSYGIWVSYAGANNIFRDNTLSQNKYNIHVSGNTHESFDQDIDTSNLVEGKPILYLRNPLNYALENTDAYGVVYVVRGENVRLSNLNFAQNNYANITFFETTNSTIENMNSNWQAFFGITLISSSNNMILNNNIYEQYIGLYFQDCLENTVTNNYFYDSGNCCIYISRGSSNTIQNNFFYNNRHSISNSNSEQNIICDNTIDGGITQIYINGCNSDRIERNSIHNAHTGLFINGGSLNEVSDNNIQGNSSAGISLNRTTNNIVSNNEIYNNSMFGGIILQAGNQSAFVEGNLISNNKIYNNSYGIYTWGWGFIKNNTITDNNIYNHSGPAIFFGRNAVENKIIKNTISDNTYGVNIRTFSRDNQIYNNNFINNSIQAIIDGDHAGNLFNLDRPIGGNYWSNWTGPDNDNDGFVDIPYVFTGVVDNLPWAHQDGWGPAKAIIRIINQVSDLNLQNGIDNSLDAKLEAAAQALDDINQNNDVAAINALQAFINAVEAQRGNKISEADADALISAAQEIIAMLSGT